MKSTRPLLKAISMTSLAFASSNLILATDHASAKLPSIAGVSYSGTTDLCLQDLKLERLDSLLSYLSSLSSLTEIYQTLSHQQRPKLSEGQKRALSALPSCLAESYLGELAEGYLEAIDQLVTDGEIEDRLLDTISRERAAAKRKLRGLVSGNQDILPAGITIRLNRAIDRL